MVTGVLDETLGQTGIAHFLVSIFFDHFVSLFKHTLHALTFRAAG